MTDAELTILSLVAEGTRYGHEIQQLIDERGLREWLTIGFSSVFYILNKLEQQNLVESEVRSSGRTPGRKVYQITEAGRGVLQTAVSDLLRQPRSLGAGFELGLANLYVLKPRQVYKVLHDHRQELKLRLSTIERSWQNHQNDHAISDHIRALYTHSIAIMKAEQEWLETFISDWADRYPAVTDSPTEPKPIMEGEQANRAKTQLHRRTSPDAAKLIQKLHRPKDE